MASAMTASSDSTTAGENRHMLHYNLQKSIAPPLPLSGHGSCNTPLSLTATPNILPAVLISVSAKVHAIVSHHKVNSS